MSKPHRSRRLALAVTGALLFPSPLLATQLQAVSLNQMTRYADVIVVAEVGDRRSLLDHHGGRAVTLTDLRVIDAIHGSRAGDMLTVYQVGGTAEGVTTEVIGALELVPGERMVFFGKRFRDWVVSVGIGLGKFPVVQRGGTSWVLPHEQGRVFGVDPSPASLADDTPRLLPWFVKRVHEIIALPSAGERR